MVQTIKQIADDLGIDKQRVYRYILRHDIAADKEENGTLYYDDAAVARIKYDLTVQKQKQKKSKTQPEPAAAVYDILAAELAAKDRQIAAQQDQISQLTAALEHTTASLHAAQESLQAAQALHAGTIQQQLELDAAGEPEPVEPVEPEKKPWWRFW